MKRLCLGLVIAALFGIVLAVSGFNKPEADLPSRELIVQREARNPWTHTNLNNDPSDFQFAIVSDRTGGHRAEVFSQAVERLNWLQPEFVLSVGDLIEGGNKSPQQLAAEWDEFDRYIGRLQMPFFYVPGNHDAATAASDKVWGERLGRRYYHFVYRNVLFLCLNTEDKPAAAAGHLGKEQIAYAQQVLEANRGVRWTIVSMHKPLWTAKDIEATGWLEVEKALAGRQYTVFVGHIHHYQKFVRNGQNYYQLATTGGSSKMRGVAHGEFDHIVWVTMKKTGPVLANILLDAILPEDLQTPHTTEPGVSTAARKPCQPVQGTVFLDDAPTPQAYVVFEGEGENNRMVRADGVVESDGSFTLSTYTAYDGIPVGDYRVTVVWRKPFYQVDGKPGPNLLPERYSKADTSGLKATIKQGRNDVALELKR